MKKVLICGTSGFMGNNIANYLLNHTDYDVYAVTHTKNVAITGSRKFAKEFSCDLTTQQGIDHVFKGMNYDIVIQAAATTSGAKDIIEKPYIHVTDNVIMNTLLLRAAYDYNVKQFIFLSCTVMYQPGDSPKKESDFNESDTIFPTYFGVGSMKVYIEKQMQFYASLGKTMHLAIRHTNTYGPYDKYDYEHSHVFGATLRKVMDATDKIEVWGTGTETSRDLIYVEDVCELIYSAINKLETKFAIVNAGIGRSIPIKELVEKIITASGKNLAIEYNINKPVIPTKLCVDTSYAYKLFQWTPKTDLDSGIAKTIQWYNTFYNKG